MWYVQSTRSGAGCGMVRTVLVTEPLLAAHTTTSERVSRLQGEIDEIKAELAMLKSSVKTHSVA